MRDQNLEEECRRAGEELLAFAKKYRSALIYACLDPDAFQSDAKFLSDVGKFDGVEE